MKLNLEELKRARDKIKQDEAVSHQNKQEINLKDDYLEKNFLMELYDAFLKAKHKKENN